MIKSVNKVIVQVVNDNISKGNLDGNIYNNAIDFNGGKLILGSQEGQNKHQVNNAKVVSIPTFVKKKDILYREEGLLGDYKDFYDSEIPVILEEGDIAWFPNNTLVVENLIHTENNISYFGIDYSRIYAIQDKNGTLFANSGYVIGTEYFGDNVKIEDGNAISYSKSGLIIGVSKPELGKIQIKSCGSPLNSFEHLGLEEYDVCYYDKRFWYPFEFEKKRLIAVPQWYLLAKIEK